MNHPLKRFGHLFLLAAVPAAVFTSCGNDDDNPTPTPVPDKGKVLVSHAAASANLRVKALVNDTEVGQLDYGQSSQYLDVNTGAQTLKINVATSNTTAAQQSVTVEKDKNYSVFAYPATATTVGLLPVADDLTAPASGQAKIRIVHLVLSGPTAVKLSQSTVAGPVDLPGASAGFPTASAFVGVPTGSYNLAVTTTGTGGITTTVASVGDGSGSGTGTKNYEAGKIYTVVVRGISGSLDPALQPKAVIIQNN